MGFQGAARELRILVNDMVHGPYNYTKAEIVVYPNDFSYIDSQRSQRRGSAKPSIVRTLLEDHAGKVLPEVEQAVRNIAASLYTGTKDHGIDFVDAYNFYHKPVQSL